MTDCVRLDPAGEDPGMAFQTVETNELDEVLGMEDVRLVLLSFFDGIGAAHVALANLGVKPCCAMSFETDEECTSVIRAHLNSGRSRWSVATTSTSPMSSWIASQRLPRQPTIS